MLNSLNPKCAGFYLWVAVTALSHCGRWLNWLILHHESAFCYRRKVAYRSGAGFGFTGATPFQRFLVYEYYYLLNKNNVYVRPQIFIFPLSQKASISRKKSPLEYRNTFNSSLTVGMTCMIRKMYKNHFSMIEYGIIIIDLAVKTVRHDLPMKVCKLEILKFLVCG